MLNLRMLPGHELERELLVQELVPNEHPDDAVPKHLYHGLETAERDAEECAFVVKASLHYDGVEVRIEPEHVSVGLMGDNHPGRQVSPGCLPVELAQQCEDYSRDLSKQTPIMAKKRPQSLRHREDELPMRKIKQDFFSQMLCKQQRPLLTARWVELQHG